MKANFTYSMNLNRKVVISILFSIILFSGLFTFQKMRSTTDGLSDLTDIGCTCHNSRNTATSFTSSNSTGSWIVKPGSSNTITVSLKNSTLTACGIDIGIKDASTGGSNAGTCSPGSDLKLLNGELIHNSKKTMNQKFDFVFNWTAPTTPGIYYLKAAGTATDGNGGVSNSAWEIMTPQSITVSGVVNISAPTTGSSACIGSDYIIKWNSLGLNLVKIEYSIDGGSNFTTITNSSQASNGQYTWAIPSNTTSSTNCVIKISDPTDASINKISSTFTIEGAPSITSDLTPISICTGLKAIFTVAATGSNLSYQWKKGNVNIGTNSASFTINSVQNSDAGDYSVEVTNTNCNLKTTSSTATLSINPGVDIVEQPTSRTACIGGSVTLSCKVNVAPATTFQWQKGGVDISGKITQDLKLDNVQLSDSGTYTLRISNGPCNKFVTTEPAKLKIITIPVINNKLTDQTVQAGDDVEFKIDAGNDPTATYQWKKDGQNLFGKTSATLAITNAQSQNEGLYQALVINDCGSTTSNTAKLTVIQTKTGPILKLSADPIFFGKTILKTTKDLTVTGFIMNTGDDDLIINSIIKDASSTNPDDFTIITSGFPLIVKAKTALDIKFKFTPKAEGISTAKIAIASNTLPNPVYATLNGEGISETTNPPVVTVTSSTLDLGSANINTTNTKSVTLENKGTTIAKVLGITTQAPFSVDITTFPFDIAVGGSMVLNYLFKPTTIGDFNFDSKINIELLNTPLTVSLKGKSTGSSVDEFIESNSEYLTISPNPQVSNSNIKFEIKNNAIKDLAIIDINGQLINSFKINDITTFDWNCRDFNNLPISNGVYFVKLNCNSKVIVTKFMISK